MAVSREALACRRTQAANAAFGPIAEHMPLVEPFAATVQQMADTTHVTPEQVQLLFAWTRELQVCRNQVSAALQEDSPTAVARVFVAWNDEDEIYVRLSQRRLTWGEAAMQLRTVRSDLLSDLTDQAIKVSAQLHETEDAKLSRRVAILNALTNLAP